MGIEAIETDGNDVLNVVKIFSKAKDYISKKKKPFFIKFNTYRYLEHCGPNNDDNLDYRPKKEIEYWKKKCPIKLFESYLIRKKLFSKKEIDKIEDEVMRKVLQKYNISKKFKKPIFSNLKKILYNEKNYKI